MKKVLIDHGSTFNAGDTGMLEGILGLYSQVPDVQCHVVDRIGMRTNAWDLPYVRRCPPLDPEPFSSLRRLRFFWRFFSLLSSSAWLKLDIAVSELTGANWRRVRRGKSSSSLDELCSEYDAFHVVGGGNLTDTFPFVLASRCALIQCFARQRRPVLLTGQQIGPFRSRIFQTAVHTALREASFVGLREPTESVLHCKQAGLECNRYGVLGDDSFGLDSCQAEEVASALHKYGLKPYSYIAANVRIADYASQHANYIPLIANVLVKLRKATGLPVVIVPVAFNDHDSDVKSGERLKAAFPDSVQVVLTNDVSNAKMIKAICGMARMAIGVSYHFCTFALSHGVPTISLFSDIYYAQKSIGLASFWNDPRIAVNLASTNEQDLFQIAMDVFNDEAMNDALRSRCVKMRESWRTSVAEKIEEVILKCNPMSVKASI